MRKNTFNVTSSWTEIFDVEVTDFYVLHLRELADLECSGMITFCEFGNNVSGNVIQNIENRGVVNISTELPTTFRFTDSPSRTYELQKSLANKLEIRITSGTNIIVTFTLFYGGIPQPSATISDSNNQFVSSTTTEELISFDTNDSLNRISHTSNSSQIVIQVPGTYRFEIVAQLGGATADVDIWLRKNGVDIPRTNRRKTLQSANDYVLLSITSTQTAAANDYFELVQASTSTLAGLIALAAQVSPTRPATPSIVLTVNKISD